MDYKKYIKEYEALYTSALGGSSSVVQSVKKGKTAPVSMPGATVLIVAPHPDDECLMGALPLRMKLEQNAKVYVIPFSLGSKPERQAERDQELNKACVKLGFERVGGVAGDADSIFKIIQNLKITHVFSPHEHDGHPTHVKTYLACREAIEKYLMTEEVAASDEEACVTMYWLQSEFWQSMPAPNLLVQLSSDHVATLGLALMQHQGEIARNPYHLRLPAWYSDQVRRGSELIFGVGAAATPFLFGQLYTQILCGGCDGAKWKHAEKLVLE